MMEEEIEINGNKYILESSIKKEQTMPKSMKGKEYCIIRTYSAGVFAGWIDRKAIGREHTIFNSRRIFHWEGAASLSQLANDGVSVPDECKFAQIVPKTDLKEVIEVIPCTANARKSIKEVAVWQK